jgi:hypothetical protein
MFLLMPTDVHWRLKDIDNFFTNACGDDGVLIFQQEAQ